MVDMYMCPDCNFYCSELALVKTRGTCPKCKATAQRQKYGA